MALESRDTVHSPFHSSILSITSRYKIYYFNEHIFVHHFWLVQI